MDLGCSLALVSLFVAIGAAFGVRLFMRGDVHYARIEAAGSSPLLGRRAMEGAYWALQPLARLCIKLGIGPNAITLGSMGLALLAAAALALGHFGVAAVITAVASLGDALDGLVARMSGVASDAGEVLDAAVDRYFEGVFLGGLAIFYHNDVAMLILVLAALLGSFMVSYATAKAEACRAEVPRGWMRRQERAVYLNVGITLVPIMAALAPAAQSATWGKVPVLVTVSIVALFSNWSAISRLGALARVLRARDAISRDGDGVFEVSEERVIEEQPRLPHPSPPPTGDGGTSGIRSSVTTAAS